ncbi:MAG: MerR family transcriptional regulator [Candidatus Dormibacteria bacterium]
MPHQRHDSGSGPDADQSDRRIAEASRQVGVSPRVLRYWEQSGVVRPSRDPAGRRHFNRHDLLAISLIRELLDSSETSISDLRLIRELAEREVTAAMADPLTRLRLLFQRQAAEEGFHRLIDAAVPQERGPLPRPGHDPGPGPLDPLSGPHATPED